MVRDVVRNLRKPFQKVGEDFFLRRIDKSRVPEHVAVIMDGNGRWATNRGLSRVDGHRAGVRTTREIVRVSARLGISWLTLYTFSVENWQRPESEVGGLMRLFESTMRAELPELIKNRVKVTILGDVESLPEGTRSACREIEEATAANTGLRLGLALNYGARQEITRAVNRLVETDRMGPDERVTEEILADNLYTRGMPDPALLIRTGGEFRLSNFLLWQLAYAELWVSPTLWPDFGSLQFLRAVRDFGRRRRRFGRVESGDLG